MISAVAPFVIALAMLLVLVRAWHGPSLFDRVLAINTFGVLTTPALVQLAFQFLEGDVDHDFRCCAFRHRFGNTFGAGACLARTKPVRPRSGYQHFWRTDNTGTGATCLSVSGRT